MKKKGREQSRPFRFDRAYPGPCDERNGHRGNLGFFQLIRSVVIGFLESAEGPIMSNTIKVFNYNENPHKDRARLHYSRSAADDLVNKGLAIWVHRFAVQKRAPRVEMNNADRSANVASAQRV